MRGELLRYFPEEARDLGWGGHCEKSKIPSSSSKADGETEVRKTLSSAHPHSGGSSSGPRLCWRSAPTLLRMQRSLSAERFTPQHPAQVVKFQPKAQSAARVLKSAFEPHSGVSLRMYFCWTSCSGGQRKAQRGHGTGQSWRVSAGGGGGSAIME